MGKREVGDPRKHTVPDMPFLHSAYRCKSCDYVLGYLIEKAGWVYLRFGANKILAHKEALECPRCGTKRSFSRYEVRASNI